MYLDKDIYISTGIIRLILIIVMMIVIVVMIKIQIEW